MASDKRLAVLIDADNVSDKYIKLILEEVTSDGVATYRRIYGDWTSPSLSSWKRVLLDNSIQPIQQYCYTTGKNSTDSALIIDAMDILYSKQVEGFCIVSSDSDFTRLAARLRESGMLVIGMGEQKTPKSFVSACNRFKYLDLLAGADRQDRPVPAAKDLPPPPKNGKSLHTAASKAPAPPVKAIAPPPPAKAEEMTDIKTISAAIRTIIEEYSDEDDWIFTGTVGNLLAKRFPDFDVRNFGFKKLTPFLMSLGILEINRVRSKDGDGRLVFARLKE